MNIRSFFNASLLFLVYVSVVPMHGMDNDVEMQPSLPSIPAESVVKDDGAKIKAEIDVQLKMVEGITEIPVHLRDGTDFTLKLDDNDLLTQGSYKESLQEQIEYQESHDVETRQFILARVTSADDNNRSFVSYYPAHQLNRYVFSQVKTVRVNETNLVDDDDDVQSDYMLLMPDYATARYDLGERYVKPPVMHSRVRPIKDSINRAIRSSDDIEYFVYDPLEHNKGFVFIGTYKNMIQADLAAGKFRNRFCRNQYRENDNNDLRNVAYAMYHQWLMSETNTDTESGRKQCEEHRSIALDWLGGDADCPVMVQLTKYYLTPLIRGWNIDDVRTIQLYSQALKFVAHEEMKRGAGIYKSFMIQHMRAVVGLVSFENESQRKEILGECNQFELLKDVEETKFKIEGGTTRGLSTRMGALVHLQLGKYAFGLREHEQARIFFEHAYARKECLRDNERVDVLCNLVCVHAALKPQDLQTQRYSEGFGRYIQLYAAESINDCGRSWLKFLQAENLRCGYGVHQDCKEALKYYEACRHMHCGVKSCLDKTRRSYYAEAELFFEGRNGIVKDHERAFKAVETVLLSIGSNNLSTTCDALSLRSQLLFSGFGKKDGHGGVVGRNYTKAVEGFSTLLSLCKMPEDESCILVASYYLGLCYAHGYGVERNTEKAVKFLSTACKDTCVFYPEARLQLGSLVFGKILEMPFVDDSQKTQAEVRGLLTDLVSRQDVRSDFVSQAHLILGESYEQTLESRYSEGSLLAAFKHFNAAMNGDYAIGTRAKNGLVRMGSIRIKHVQCMKALMQEELRSIDLNLNKAQQAGDATLIQQLLSKKQGITIQIDNALKMIGDLDKEKQDLRATSFVQKIPDPNSRPGNSIAEMFARQRKRVAEKKERKEQKQAAEADEDASGAKRLRLENGSSSSSSSSSSS